MGGEAVTAEGSVVGWACGRILSCLHRELPPSWHHDLPVSKLTLQQGFDFGQGFTCKYALNMQL